MDGRATFLEDGGYDVGEPSGIVGLNFNVGRGAVLRRRRERWYSAVTCCA